MKALWSIWHHYTSFSYKFSEGRCTLFTESSNQSVSQNEKRLWKFRFLGCFSIAKSEECNQKVWNFLHQSDITIACSAPYFIEVGGRGSLEVPTKGSPRGKKKRWKVRFLGCFLKQKRRSGTQTFEVSLINLEWLFPVQLHNFVEVGARFSLKVATKGSCRGKRNLKI